MNDILEVIVDQVLYKVSAMPFSIRVFAKYLYEECRKKWKNMK